MNHKKTDMSWDIILFNSSQKIVSLENLDEDLLKPIDFDKILKSSFDKVKKTENHIEIIGKDFTIEFFEDEDVESNKTLNLYGENGLFELIKIAKKESWQIYDSGVDEMLNLENPTENGYTNFQKYLNDVINGKG